MESSPSTHHFISRSVVAASEICKFSSPRKDSGIRSSGGIFENRKEEITEIGKLVSSERCSDGVLRTGTSLDGCPCGISAPNACRGDCRWVNIRVVSEVEGSRLVCTPVITTGTSTGSAPPDG